MQITEVQGKALIKRFHRVPFTIYKNDPYWIPHIQQDVEKVFSTDKNKLYKDGGEAIRWILTDNGKDIGRVAAFINPITVNISDQPTAGMGFFECIENKEAAFLLFETCIKWLKQRGMEAMDGPINYGERNQYWGLQVTNFDNPPIYLMNYNLPYYQSFFEEFGFKVYFEQYTYYRSVTEPLQPIFHRKYNQIKNDPKFVISNIVGKKLAVAAEEFRIVYNAAWGGHDHFREMSAEGAQKLFKSMKAVIDPRIIIFVHYEGKPVAFFVNLPELNRVFQYLNGNLNLAGKIKFLWHKWLHPSDRLMGLIFGVVKEWQGKGLEAGMIVYGEKTIVPMGIYKDVVLSWVGDFNPRMLKVVENLGTTKWRTYYTYRYLFDRNKEFKRCPVSGH